MQHLAASFLPLAVWALLPPPSVETGYMILTTVSRINRGVDLFARGHSCSSVTLLGHQ